MVDANLLRVFAEGKVLEDPWVGLEEVYLQPHCRHRAAGPSLDRGAAHLKDELMPRYAELIYNGLWFSPEREMLQALIDKSQDHVEGIVRLKLYKGSARVVGRKSPRSLYSLAHVTFEEDAVYDQRDAEGFIRLNALRLRLAARRDTCRENPLPFPPPQAGEG